MGTWVVGILVCLAVGMAGLGVYKGRKKGGGCGSCHGCNGCGMSQGVDQVASNGKPPERMPMDS